MLGEYMAIIDFSWDVVKLLIRGVKKKLDHISNRLIVDYLKDVGCTSIDCVSPYFGNGVCVEVAVLQV